MMQEGLKTVNKGTKTVNKGTKTVNKTTKDVKYWSSGFFLKVLIFA